MLPKLRGDPCRVFSNGPYNLETRRYIREQAEGRFFIGITRGLVTAFDFTTKEWVDFERNLMEG